MNLSDDLIRHELRSLATPNMTRSRSQSTDSVNESVKSTINETKQSIYIDEILQDDIGHNYFCLSCCFKFEDNTSFLRHFGQHHLNQVKLTYSQEQFLKHNSFEYRFLSILIDFRIKSKFLRKYSHDLIVLNEETALMLDELNKEENEDDDSDSSDKELSVHDENNLYDSRPKLSLLFVDFSIIKPGRIFSYLKDLFVKSYPVFKNSNDARKEVALFDSSDRVKESNENKNPKKTSSQVFHSRNACKKLKCPKCNWHYKYRETLDIHMKEKHSTDLSQTMSQQCVYCIENIQHPRLGRGEQYKCGYKPYRCDICDYSTTTKGNLSIHMQSDKHVNNLKEIGSKSQEKIEARDCGSESNDIRSIDLNRKFVNKKYLNSKILAGNLPQDHSNNSLTTTSNKSKSISPQTEIDISLLCPLCYIGFNQQILLENHLKESHCVVNEDTIKNLVKTGRKTEQNKTMKTSSDDESIYTNQENDFEMNVDNQADIDLFIDNLINKHNDILDTLLSNYLFKNRLAYTQYLAKLLGPSQTVIVDENLDKSTLVQCANCSHNDTSAKFANLTDFKQHLVESHEHDPLQLSQSLLHNCLQHLTKACAAHDHDLRRFLISNNRSLSEHSIHYTIASLTLSRMNKTFALNKPAAVNKLAFSAESLLSSNQPPSKAQAQAQAHTEHQLLSYFKSAQMANAAQPSPLFNQFFLPFMFSSSAPVTNGPGSPPPQPPPPDNDDSLKSDNLDESLELGGPVNRRRRTRITEQQLKILRQYFDINKSPSDEQVVDIARQTQLQAKVIKHWFRNTLFKERQKDKDSPYNFNNPPLTQLNLEEYEKTGKIVAEPAVPVPPACLGQHDALNESTTTESNENSEHHLNVDMDDADMEANMTSSRCSSVGGQKHRPNRTKFTESQSKALSAAFKHQKYPKDEQISQLSAQLGLKPRVITVWFQNARQKARKSTTNNTTTTTTNTTTTTTNNNNNNTTSTNDDDLNDYYDLNDDECDETHSHVSSSTDKSLPAATTGDTALALAAAANNKALQLQLAMSLLAAHQQHQQHQQQIQQDKSLSVSSSSSSACASSSSSSSSTDSKKDDDDDDDELDADDDEDDLDADDDNEDEDETDSAANLTNTTTITDTNLIESTLNKAAANTNTNTSNATSAASTATKRLRTTILPEQQEFLMQKYQLDQNPSRKMLDEIAKQVRLKKRVVQVWFQNTRARERKGIIKVASPLCAQSNQSKCGKRCAMCSHTFRSQNDLESHLILKHNYSYEQASALHQPGQDQPASSSPPPPPPPPTANGLNSILMSTLFAQLQQQQQQQHQQQQPFDLSFKCKALGRENGEQRSRSNSGSGAHKLNMLGQKQSMSSNQQQQQQQQQQRRVRTQMTQYQVNVMRLIFAEYKTPTMNECELMGKEINLKKRVVQVWFQNARAKEKKNAAHKSILFSNSANNDLSNFEFSSEQCLLCGVKYCASGATSPQQQREHLFSKQHLNKLIQFVTKIAMDNGANSVDFSAKSGTKNDDDDDSELDDEVNSGADDDNDNDDDNDDNQTSPQNESHESKQPPPPPPSSSSSFDINRLLQMPAQTAPNSQFYNYFLYSNLLTQPKLMPSSASSESSSSCSSASPPFYSQFHNPMLAQLYAAFAAQHHAQTTSTLDALNVAKSVQADIDQQLSAAPATSHTIQYTVDGSTKTDLTNKHNVDGAYVQEHLVASHYVCRACKSVSLSRDVLVAHQCPNQPLNKNLVHTNLISKLEQIVYKCVTCAAEAHPDCVFANAADFVQHSNKLGHCLNSKRKEHLVDVDSNNNCKKIKY